MDAENFGAAAQVLQNNADGNGLIHLQSSWSHPWSSLGTVVVVHARNVVVRGACARQGCHGVETGRSPFSILPSC